VRILFYRTAREWTTGWRAFAALARGLSDRGHAVAVAAPPGAGVERQLDHEAYELLPIDPDASVPIAAHRLRGMLQERFIETVCVHSSAEQVAATLAARLADRAAVLRRVPVGERLVLDRRARLALRLSSTGFVFGAEQDAQRAPVPRQARFAHTVAPLGVDAAAYESVRPATRPSLGLGAATRLVVCVCNNATRIRVAHVLRVIALLAARHPELRLLIVGAGADDDDLRVHASALRIGKVVSFLPAYENVLPILATADLGWVVADGDDGAYATLDLLASRVPVLADRGALAARYVPDGIAGLLLPPGDPHGAAAAIARLLARDDERAAMGSAAQTRVAREYSESAMVEAFECAAIAASDRTLW
jgi:glycosyltransferase involved in cell wall biosynthesis